MEPEGAFFMLPKVPILSAGYLSSCAGAAGGHVGPRQGLAGSGLERGEERPQGSRGQPIGLQGTCFIPECLVSFFFSLVSCAYDKEGQEVE